MSEAPWAPGRKPLIGHLPLLRSGIVPALQNLSGAGPVVRLRIGPIVGCLVNDAALAHEVLVEKADSFTREREIRGFRTVMRNGLLTLEGAPHHERRRITQPAFGRKNLAALVPMMCEVALDCADGWPLSRAVPVDEEMFALATRLSCRGLFGDDATEFLRELTRVSHQLETGIFWRFTLPSWYRFLPTPENLRYRRIVRWTRDALRTIHARRIPTVDENSFLGQLKRAAEGTGPGAPLSREDIVDEMITFWLGGMGTTAGTLTWAWHELARHERIEAEVQREADAVFNTGQGFPEDPAAALPYTNQVVNEVLRLHPPVPLVSREVKHPVELNGHLLSPGTTVLVSIQAVHLDPGVYPRPEVFDPERWRPGAAATVPRHSFLPFGAGAHRCAAAAYGSLSGTVALAALASRLRLRPTDPALPVRTATGPAARPHGLMMRAQPREPGGRRTPDALTETSTCPAADLS